MNFGSLRRLSVRWPLADEEHHMTSSSPQGVRILGSLRSTDGLGVVRMEDRFATDVCDLWSALTDPRRLALWYGEVEGDLRPGGEFRAQVYDSGLRLGRVEACEPSRRLLVTLRDANPRPGQPAETPIEVELTADGGMTVLIAEVRGLPLPLLAAYGAGVQTHVEDLAAHIAGQERGDADARFDELFPTYQDLAADIG
jgi:uncharacterized protein YndB with AHSA1/START domain